MLVGTRSTPTCSLRVRPKSPLETSLIRKVVVLRLASEKAHKIFSHNRYTRSKESHLVRLTAEHDRKVVRARHHGHNRLLHG